MLASAIALVALMAGGSSVATARPACSLKAPLACRTTNQLFSSVGFGAALRRFVGPQHPWRYRHESQYNAAARLIGGPPDAPIRIAPSLVRFSACAVHNCGAKGAMFVASDGTIRAVALLDLDCQKNCAGLTLVVIVRSPSPALTAAARRWAEDALAKERRDYPSVYAVPGTDLPITTVRTIVNRGTRTTPQRSE